MKYCDICDGDGYTVLSCCGDNIKGNDIDLCPSCLEHCGMEEEPCECLEKEYSELETGEEE